MNLDNPIETPALPTEEELREMLAASERRVEEDFKGKRKVATLLLIVPALIFAVWIAVFLISYDAGHPPPKEMISLGAPPLPVNNANPDADPDVDRFLPARLRSSQNGKPAPQPAGKTIDKSDIEFATQLLNFSHAADAPQPKKK